MWFEHAHGKEKIIHMFNGELPLLNMELDKLIYHDTSRLTICLNTKKIPLYTPEKWKKKTFNSLAVSLTFTEILTFTCNGGNIGFECNPIVRLDRGVTYFSIENNEFNLFCAANYMFIDDVTPYLDNRWK
ncbi:Imm50 family immunity protein [Scandinavium sp. M-37]|uniref:Imm50 family immunity protein n=1 Tax=Scandinavium sp. M-37 TaxID=3373077 RepID=UPI003745B47C